MKVLQTLALASSLLISGTALANGPVPVGNFSKNQLAGWEPKAFSGKTQYNLVQEGGKTVLKATSNAAASGLGRRMKVDLTKTPVLNWSWRIENKLGQFNEQTKAGDDYAARVYVIVDGGILPWNTKALNYVWSSNSNRGTNWGNAYVPNNAKMFAIRGKQDQAGQWMSERRNIRADFKHFFGKDITHIDGIAIMTDTDNTKGQAVAVYGDIFFTAR